MSPVLSLEWRNHGETLTSTLWSYFKEEHLVDVNLSCHGQRLRAHRLVLEALLPNFRESLQGTLNDRRTTAGNGCNCDDDDQQEVQLPFTTGHADDLYYLMEFIYTGRVTSIPEEHLSCLLAMAKDVGLQALGTATKNQETSYKTSAELVSSNTDLAESDVVSTQNSDKTAGVPSRGESVISIGDDVKLRELEIMTMQVSPDIVEPLENADSLAKAEDLALAKGKQNAVRCAVDTASASGRHEALTNPCRDNLRPCTDFKNEEEERDRRSDGSANTSDRRQIGEGNCQEEPAAAARDRLTNRGSSGDSEKRRRGTNRKRGPKGKSSGEERSLGGGGCDDDDDRKYQCERCDYRARKRLVLYEHRAAIHKVDVAGNPLPDMKCPQCNYVCVAKHQLKQHMRRRHTEDEDKPYKCTECSYSAVYSNAFKLHMRIRHQHRRDYMCDVCGYRAQTSGSLNKHVRAIHEGLKRFKCDQCDAQYADAISFKLHKQGHAGVVVNEFVCHVCAQSYPRRCQLRIHLRKKHEIELELGGPRYASVPLPNAAKVKGGK